MKSVKIKLLAGVAVLILLIGSNWGYQTYQEVGRLKQQLHNDMNIWIHMQWFAFNEFDHSLAGALSTSSVAKRQDYLKDAYQEASYLAQYSTYGAAAVPYLHSLSGNVSFFWDESSRYLEYAGSQQMTALKPSQLENLQIMRQYTSKMRPYMKQLNDITNKNQYTSDNSEQVEQIVSKLVEEIGNLPEIGSNDKEFNDFWYSKNPYKIKKAGIVFEGEKKFTEAELALRSQTFMGDLWPQTNGQIIGSIGGGSDNLFGESLSFAAHDDNKAMSPYIIDVTKTGGHILRVRFDNPNGNKHDEPLGELDKDKAILLAKEWIDRWGEEPLVLNETKDENTNLRLTFIPISENISKVQQKVDIVIDLKKGGLIELDAMNYFIYYKQDIPLNPKLSPEEASAKVNDLLEITGVPALEVRDGVLVYAIPVKGIERVTHLYINAIYGNEEGFAFTW